MKIKWLIDDVGESELFDGEDLLGNINEEKCNNSIYSVEVIE